MASFKLNYKLWFCPLFAFCKNIYGLNHLKTSFSYINLLISYILIVFFSKKSTENDTIVIYACNFPQLCIWGLYKQKYNLIVFKSILRKILRLFTGYNTDMGTMLMKLQSFPHGHLTKTARTLPITPPPPTNVNSDFITFPSELIKYLAYLLISIWQRELRQIIQYWCINELNKHGLS